MITELTQWILDSIRAHGAASVFTGVMIESIIVPIPSPLIIMGAGAVLIAPDMSWGYALAKMLKLIVLPGAFASTLGAFIIYGLAYWCGKKFINRCSGFLGFDWCDVEAVESGLKKRSVALWVVVLRALPVVPLSLVSAAVGAIRWPWGSFVLWTFVGSIPRCFILACLGWLMMDAYDAFARRLDLAETTVSLLIVLSSGILVLWLRKRVEKARKLARKSCKKG